MKITIFNFVAVLLTIVILLHSSREEKIFKTCYESSDSNDSHSSSNCYDVEWVFRLENIVLNRFIDKIITSFSNQIVTAHSTNSARSKSKMFWKFNLSADGLPKPCHPLAVGKIVSESECVVSMKHNDTSNTDKPTISAVKFPFTKTQTNDTKIPQGLQS